MGAPAALLVGLGVADDAAVYRLTDELAIIQTVDFFTPIVDDPRDYGRIAAANSLSDVYAMGGTPLLALNVTAWPRESLPFSILGEVLQGAALVCREARCAVVGGHSIDDREPKFGMAVIGDVHPAQAWTNSGARPGDVLVLTKPIGTGVITTALKRDLIDADTLAVAVACMRTLNAGAARAGRTVTVHAATDVTGFGLLGHLRNIVKSSGVAAEVDSSAVPLLPRVTELAAQGAIPGGSRRNLEAMTEVRWDDGVVDQYFRFFRLAGWPRGGGGGRPWSCLSSTRRKSILRSSRLAFSTMMRTRSPSRNDMPRRSPESVLRSGSKW